MTAVLALLAAAAASTTPTAATTPANDPQRGDDVIVTGQRSEGTDDYGVSDQRTATRLPLSQRETPQSVSVVTRAQIQDFQLNDVNQLLATVPGVSVFAGETDRVYYSARGFDIQTFQIDGVGLPFAFGIQTGSIDTAIYDRVEVVRGAPGLLSPTGNPSALINFVRKRPFKDFRTSASVQYGSFEALRLDADVSVPLTKSGSIRARAVGAALDTDSYLDRYQLKRWTGYGIVEADLGPNTVVSAGYGHQDHKSTGAMWGAIPLYYTDGSRIEFKRSANYAPDWSSWNVVDRQIFGDITHDFGGGWTGKVSVLRRAISEDDTLFYIYGNPDRATGLGIFSYPGAFKGETRNLSLDAYLSGKLAVAGREHDVMVGVQRGAESYLQYSSYDNPTINVSLPLATLFDGRFPKPNFPTPYTLSLDTHTVRESAYGLVRLNLADPLKVMVGGNYTHATSEGTSYGAAQNFSRSRFSPFVGATFDLTPSISAYASFATIFRPQVELNAANQILPPVEGDNLEAGLKGEWLGGRLYASAAIFQARQNNTAFGQFDATLGRTVYTPVDAKSQGIELEFGGQLLPGLQATGGFTTMKIRNQQDQPERTFVPRNLGRLNITYSPPAMPKVKLGTSIQYQSSFYFEPSNTVRIDQGDYALVDLLGRYELTPALAVSVNVRNVTNAKYLTALTFDQSRYGEPRSVLGTISFRY
ncbi:outer membrane receptor for ferric coprogen and ferric-rhodotorulic acid [Sphingomonas jinjuensis]|uniref:Outer membrane receptor for ferric coprogen and ferric-rhodotorulic acid n=1 Tax=Sphingomonas jinjuensis TaxID=535907 RepID=A0A840FL38_9SPHN|nr:TonB-dependent siderophore receptor [Sphingomonas jinjuensis]MBB4154638.1 outer membrane receptor for ferric coprogen and ferric-rhodotorulic acid [Sphingomonas jinjuensis]